MKILKKFKFWSGKLSNLNFFYNNCIVLGYYLKERANIKLLKSNFSIYVVFLSREIGYLPFLAHRPFLSDLQSLPNVMICCARIANFLVDGLIDNYQKLMQMC